MSDWRSDEPAHIRREFERKEAEQRAQEYGVQFADLSIFNNPGTTNPA